MNNQIKADHYVYRLKQNGTVVYVGEGRANRKRDKYKRPIKLRSIWDDCSVEIVANNLTKRESTEIESELILDEMMCGNMFLLNSNKGKCNKRYNYNMLASELVLDMFSVTFIRWRKTGKIAGSVSNDYYPTVCINYNPYLISRVIWVLYNKEDLDSTCVIHHIDGNHSNNHPENLMKVTYTENNIMRQSRKSKDFLWYSKINKKGDRFRTTVRLLSGKVKEISVKIDSNNPEISAETCSNLRNELVTAEFIDYPHLIPYLISVKLPCNIS